MNLIECFVSALGSLLANKMRSVLTMLGIIIGIAAVIMITSIGQGFQASINNEFEKMGAIGLQINVKNDTETKQSDLLTMDDAYLLMQHPEVASVAPLTTTSGQVRLKNPSETTRTTFIGSNQEFKDVQGVDIIHGRFLAAPDVDNASPAAVIDGSLSRRIFGRTDSVGEKISVSFWSGSMELTVVGIYKTVDFGSAYFEMPTIAYIPVTTLQKLTNRENVEVLFVNVADRSAIDRTAMEISKLLSLRHNNENKYSVENLLKQMDTINDVLGNITAFVSLVAAISLIVGGIGVMNIMLVTVTERTREIGIRKAMGATDNNIKFQFLIEAMILTAIGGFIGILLGYFGGFALGTSIQVIPVVSVPTVALTVAISSLIGIVFGVYPAGKAAKLDPIEALRYE